MRIAGRLKHLQVVPWTRPFSYSRRFYQKSGLGGIRELGPRVAREGPDLWLTRPLHRVGYHYGMEGNFTPFYADTRLPYKREFEL